MSLLVLNHASRSVIEGYFQQSRIAEERRALEYTSSVRIQAVFRGHRTRTALQAKRDAAVVVQRTFRGWLGREAYLKLKQQKELFILNAYYHYCATQIQRLFRGYWSRKFKHDYHQRKAYLARVADTSNAVRSDLEVYHNQRIQEVQQAQEQVRVAKYRAAVERSHHLVGTAARPGVYTGDFMAAAVLYDNALTCEETIKVAFKDQYQSGTLRPSSRTLTPINQSSVLPPLRARSMNRSAQFRADSASRSSTVVDSGRGGETMAGPSAAPSRTGVDGRPPFVALSKRRPKTPPYVPSLSSHEPYVDPDVSPPPRYDSGADYVVEERFMATFPRRTTATLPLI